MKTNTAIPVAAGYDRRSGAGLASAVIDRRYSCRTGSRAPFRTVATSVSEWTVDPPLANARGYGIVGEPVQLLYTNPFPLHG